MQIYIHVPFCRKRCNYCGFYSEVLPKPSLEVIDKSKGNLAILPKEQKIKSSSNQIKPLSSLFNMAKPKAVQSLADVLKAKAQKEPQTKTPKIKGPTLVDAFFSSEEANALRRNLGLELLEEKSDKNLVNLSPNTLDLQENQGIALGQVKNLSNFLGKSLDYTQLTATNEHLRADLFGQKNKSFDNAKPTLMPLRLPQNLVYSNEIQSKIYHVWLKSLLAEIKIYAEFYSDVPISSIYFGGGTPSIIAIADLEKIMRSLIKSFHINQNAEITLEANPESLTKEKALAYNKLGFNRISLGVQSLDDENLKLLGRAHTYAEAVTAFKILRQSNFHNISLDLIWGLPKQSLKNWQSDLKIAIDLDPEHISCYGLSIEEGSLFSKLNKDGSLKLPDEKLQSRMYLSTGEILQSAGFLQYEISNYAKVGHQSRHNLAYWHNADYLGFGPSSVGTVGNIRINKAKSIIEWAKDIQSGALKQELLTIFNPNLQKKNIAHFFTKEVLSSEELVFEFIMLRLRTTKGLSLEEYTAFSKKSFLQEHGSLIKKLSKHGLVKLQNNYLSFTQNGMLVSDSILEKFIK